MTEVLSAGLLLLILLGSSGLGLFVKPLLSERHRSQETTELVRLVVTMLMTFVALVLGLLTASAKASFDKVGNALTGFAIATIQLDRSLRQWGSETDPIRALLRSYTAASIAARWTGEAKPAGNYDPVPRPATIPALGDMLAQIELDIRRLSPQDPMHRRLEATCIAHFERLMQVRWRLIEDTGGSIPTPFFVVLVFWLVVVFASFGLSAPRNVLSYTTIVLGALSIASVIFVILDLDTAFDGIFAVSSQPMRDALAQLSQ